MLLCLNICDGQYGYIQILSMCSQLVFGTTNNMGEGDSISLLVNPL